MKLIIQLGDSAIPLIKGINGAKKSLDIVIFRFDHGEIERTDECGGPWLRSARTHRGYEPRRLHGQPSERAQAVEHVTARRPEGVVDLRSGGQRSGFGPSPRRARGRRRGRQNDRETEEQEPAKVMHAVKEAVKDAVKDVVERVAIGDKG